VLAVLAPGDDGMRRILVIGATSGIAQACSRLWAAEHAEFFLVARNPERLAQNANDLAARGAHAVHTHVADLNRFEGHQDLITACFDRLQTVDLVLIAHGTLPDQKACERDVALTLEAFSSNGLSVIALLTALANRMEMQGHGTLAVISSVAADRGRPSNYVYGAAKAAVTSFCSGLRARLFKSGVHVLIIKPGFVDTPMTAGLPLPAPLVTSAEAVARRIHRAVAKRRNEVYVPGFWRPIMFIIKSIPTAVFKRLNL
jgi:decaprenylphospho-beta-D-erythro-pentofuranosid-2-ulose 2-reductase